MTQGPVRILLAALASLSLGCATYQGTATTTRPSALVRDGKWLLAPGFPHVLQEASHDCGAAALSAVLRFWGRSSSPRSVSAALGSTETGRLGVSDLQRHARAQGLSSYVFFGTMDDVVYELEHGRPVIVGLGKKIDDEKAAAHYEVVVGYEPKKKLLLLLDPARGWQVDSFAGFAEEWKRTKQVTMVAFLPTAADRGL